MSTRGLLCIPPFQTLTMTLPAADFKPGQAIVSPPPSPPSHA
ncbi:hypothetical protein BOSP111201_02270 [Bordetella sputigena]